MRENSGKVGFFAALQFLTVIPLPRFVHVNAAAVRRSTVWFPVVGLLIGAVLALAGWVFSFFLPYTVVVILLLAISAAITGMLHLDGFIDTFDGAIGQRTVEERWRIMRDSHAGSYGIVSVVLLLLLKFALLTSISGQIVLPWLVIMTVTGRWSMVYAICAYPYARPDGKGKAFKEGTGWTAFIVATIITAAVYGAFIPLVGFSAFIAGAASCILVIAAASFFSKRFSGLTGDVYGALNEVSEVAVLAVITILATINLV